MQAEFKLHAEITGHLTTVSDNRGTAGDEVVFQMKPVIDSVHIVPPPANGETIAEYRKEVKALRDRWVDRIVELRQPPHDSLPVSSGIRDQLTICANEMWAIFDGKNSGSPASAPIAVTEEKQSCIVLMHRWAKRRREIPSGPAADMLELCMNDLMRAFPELPANVDWLAS
jgi:hypothetical protein